MTEHHFATEVPGKWVLAGEHTVLRGGTAIALPHPSLKLRLEFWPGEAGGMPPIITKLLVIAQDWLAARSTRFQIPVGHVKISSTIPSSAGLGSSAALSVATARWVLSLCGLGYEWEMELSRQMENYFHGKSSGMDVAVVSIGEPILFSMKDGAVRLGLKRLPAFIFSDTGLRSSTKECIEAVEKVRAEDSSLGERLDLEMGAATQEVLSGLRAYDRAVSHRDASATTEALHQIGRGMDRSRAVFQEWGLIPAGLKSPECGHWRLTGSGRGGFLVGLVE